MRFMLQSNYTFASKVLINNEDASDEIFDASCTEENYVSCNISSNPKFQFRGAHSFGLDSIEFFKLTLGNNLDMKSLSLKSTAGAILDSSADMIWKLKKDSAVLLEQEGGSHFPIGTPALPRYAPRSVTMRGGSPLRD